MKHYKKESDFQSDLITKLRDRFPGCIVMKNDANYIQGIPDLTVLYKNHWAALENKVSEEEYKRCITKRQDQNQAWYINTMNDMSFASYVYPENVEEVLNEMERSFQDCR